MKMNIRHIAGLAALIPLLTIVVPISHTSVSAAIPIAKNSPQNQSEYLVAQLFDNCRRAYGNYSVNVRQDSSNNSRLVKRLASGSRVYIVDRGKKGWVPIYEPVRGYVDADNLTSCAVIPGGKKCRRVDSIIGAAVRKSPSINSAAIRTIDSGKSVTLGDRRSNGWVEITAPVNGYVAAVNLGYCEPE